MADNYLENQYEQYQARKAALGEGTQIRKEEKEISVSASLAATEAMRKMSCPFRRGE